MKYALKYNAFHNLESIGIDGKAESLIKYTYKNGNGLSIEYVYNDIELLSEIWYTKGAAG